MEAKTATDMVLAAEDRRRKALEAADKVALAGLLAENFTYVHGSGRVEDKTSYINALGTGPIRFTGYTSNDVVVRVKDDSALVFGELRAMRHVAGESAPSRFRFVGAWSLDGEAWRLTFYQHTKFAERPHG